MNARFNSTSKGGFTLVELLVTILIIVILSVTMLPLLKPFVTQAQYSAEGVPVIGNIRTKVELFRIENDYLPGVPIADGKVKTVTVGQDTYATSIIPAASATDISGTNGVQWMQVVTTGSAQAATKKEYYYCGDVDLTTSATDGDHVWKCISVNYSDLTGKKLRPEDMQYTIVKSDGDTYYWVVACFGHGNGGLATGCGYAVAEYNDPKTKRKFVATFENYKPIDSVPLCIHVGPYSGSQDRDTLLKAGKVFMPNLTALKSNYSSAITSMRSFGWQVQE